jgi:hypothetical protein
MSDTITNFADDIFCITRPKPKRKYRQYLITWPCGATWEFDVRDLDIPEFRDGKEWGLTLCFATVRDARDMLESRGCKVEVVR